MLQLFLIRWKVCMSPNWLVSAHSGEETHTYIWTFQWSRLSLDQGVWGWGLCLHFRCSSWVNWITHISTLKLQAPLRSQKLHRYGWALRGNLTQDCNSILLLLRCFYMLGLKHRTCGCYHFYFNVQFFDFLCCTVSSLQLLFLCYLPLFWNCDKEWTPVPLTLFGWVLSVNDQVMVLRSYKN